MTTRGEKKQMKNRQQIIKKEKIVKLRQQAAQKFGFVCSICKKKKKVMQFHHKEYYDGEKTHHDFKNNLDYQLYVLPIVIERYQEFEYLCRGDHWSVTRYSKTEQMRDKLERLVEIVRDTK